MIRRIYLRVCKAAVDFARILLPFLVWIFRFGLFALAAFAIFVVVILIF